MWNTDQNYQTMQWIGLSGYYEFVKDCLVKSWLNDVEWLNGDSGMQYAIHKVLAEDKYRVYKNLIWC